MISISPAKLLIFLVISSGIVATIAETFPLSIIHINDFHARYEPTDTNAGTCDEGEECIGGLARVVYTVKELLNDLSDSNPIYINAGDSFQGTLWYNVGRWNVTSQLLNIVPADFMTLGNHEFDHGIEGVAPYLETIKTEMLVANMDARDEPTMEGKYKSSSIIVKNNRKIGVIGVILETTYDIANTGKLIFRNESDAILEEAAKLKEQGANIIIVVSHCGYNVDKIIAQNAGSVVDVIVGGHSHTFLYTGTPPGPDKPQGDYPTEVIHESGHRVLIVQASANAKYVGNITVYFDDDGNVVDYEGAPIYMSSDVPQDESISELLEEWVDEVKAMIHKPIGEARKGLPVKMCYRRECALGNLYADAIVKAMEAVCPNINAGLIYHKELLSPLNKGPITQQDIYNLAQYNDTLVAIELTGSNLLEILEDSISSVTPDSTASTSGLLQVSGLKIKSYIEPDKSPRIKEVLIRTNQNNLLQYEPLDLTKTYQIVTSRFMLIGGFGHKKFKDFGQNRIDYSGEFQALLELIKERKLITNGLDGRMIFATEADFQNGSV